MQGSKVGGKYPYNSATVPLLAELTKLLMSLVLLYQAFKRDPKVRERGPPDFVSPFPRHRAPHTSSALVPRG